MIRILAEQNSEFAQPEVKVARPVGLEIGVALQENPLSEPMQYPDPAIHRIAILQCSGVASLVFALPALQALRYAYPQAVITLLGLDWHQQFFSGRRGVVDRVNVVPAYRGVSADLHTKENEDEIEQFFKQMQAEHFDLAIQLHDSGRYANAFLKRLGAALTVGPRAPEAPPLDRWIPYLIYQSEVMRHLEVVSLVGAHPLTLEPRLPVTEEDISEASSLGLLNTQKPIAVLHPGANDPRRQWPAEKFAKVGRTLAWAGAQVLLIGDERDFDLNDEIIKAMSVEARNLAGKLSLKGLAGLLSQSHVTVGNDADLLHLAVAVGSGTVGIFWCANMITSAPLTRTRHRPSISWRVDCPVCGLNATLNDCKHEASFVADVQEIEISTSALELLKLPLQSTRIFPEQSNETNY